MAPGPLSRLGAALFLLAWRGLGLVALPALLALPRARRFVWRVPVPPAGLDWVHGASLGEHQAIAAIEHALGRPVWRTYSSWRSTPPDAAPAPLDLPFVAASWFRRARPARLLLVEAERWPGWVQLARAAGVPVVVVGARPGRRSARWRWLGGVADALFEGVQELPAAEIGDLKADAPAAPARRALPVGAVVGASLRGGDGAAVLQAWAALPGPRPPLVLAPRHADATGPALWAGLQAHAAALGLDAARASGGGDLAHAHLLLLDTHGELDGVVRAAAAVFVGGTFDPSIGGHSPAAALAAGVPVVAGPARGANAAAWAGALAGRVFSAGAPGQPLAAALAAALTAGRAPPPPAGAAGAALRARLPGGWVPPPRAPRPWLRPLSPLFAAAAARVGAARARRARRAPIPVIGVGGLTVGGAGKTPVARWLAARLPGAAVLSRGHRRPGPGPALRAGAPGQPPPAPLGDEAELHRRDGTPVWSGPDRAAAAVAAAAAGAQVIVLDDGFQHRGLHRDLDVVVVDPEDPDGGGPLPGGDGREPEAALVRAGVIVLLRSDGAPISAAARADWAARWPAAAVVRAQRGRAALRGPTGATAPPPPEGLVLVTGTAAPGRVLWRARQAGVRLRGLCVLADHAPLPDPLPPGALLTEKDAARAPAGAPVWVLLDALEIDDATAFAARIEAATGLRLHDPHPGTAAPRG